MYKWRGTLDAKIELIQNVGKLFGELFAHWTSQVGLECEDKGNIEATYKNPKIGFITCLSVCYVTR